MALFNKLGGKKPMFKFLMLVIFFSQVIILVLSIVFLLNTEGLAGTIYSESIQAILSLVGMLIAFILGKNSKR